MSLYGATKLASEQLALEYGSTYGFPVWINRCGVLAGAGQFGRADQGIFALLGQQLAARNGRSATSASADAATRSGTVCIPPISCR